MTTLLEPKNSILKNILRSEAQAFENICTKNKSLPFYIKKEFDELLKCSDPKRGVVRLHCSNCNNSQFLAFSCKRRGLCPSCTTRRMHSTAASLVDHILPQVKVRQWVLSFPFRLRYLQAYDGEVLSSILRIYFRVIRNFYRSQLKGFEREVGAVTFIQRFGGSLNLNVHFHTLFLEGCYIKDHAGSIQWRELRAI